MGIKEKNEEFKVGDRVREKKTGKEIEIIELLETYDVDEKRAYRNCKVQFSTFEDSKDFNTLGEIDVSEIERFDD